MVFFKLRCYDNWGVQNSVETKGKEPAWNWPNGKLLTLHCVWNKDRMAVEPIVRLTRTSVLEVLRGIGLIVHTLVPEKNRFWKTNESGVCKRPIAVESGSQGKVLVLDYDFELRETRLVELRLQPVDVHVRKETFKDARDLCFTNGIVFVSELGSGTIRVIDLEGKVCLKQSYFHNWVLLVCHRRA